MKIKLDENLPHRLAAVLKDLGHHVHTTHEERLVGHLDAEIWRAAQKESRFLITQTSLFPTLGNLLLVRIMASCWCDFIRQAGRT